MREGKKTYSQSSSRRSVLWLIRTVSILGYGTLMHWTKRKTSGKRGGHSYSTVLEDRLQRHKKSEAVTVSDRIEERRWGETNELRQI